MVRRLFVFAALLAGLLQSDIAAQAQPYPSKPIKLVVGFAPGGGTDTIARITAEFLQKRLGQAVVVENRPGAASAIATDYVAKSAPDGYTLLVGTAELVVLPAARKNLPYDVTKDFTYIIRPFVQNPLIAVGPSSPYSSTKELIEGMKKNPGKVRWGHPGIGGINHIGTVMMESAIGAKGVPISYTGAGPLFLDLAAGNVDFYTGASHPPAAGLKIIGPIGTRRHPAYPDMPTFEELGYKGASYDAWFAFVGPANLPKPVLDKLTTEMQAVFKDPDAIAKFKGALSYVPEDNPLMGDAFKAYVVEQVKVWSDVATRENITVQQ